MKERDFQDSNRPIAPLKPAEDSIVFNSTGHTLQQSIDELRDLIGEKIWQIILIILKLKIINFILL